MAIEKLTIYAYSDAGQGKSNEEGSFSVMLNPNKYSRTHTINYAKDSSMGVSGTLPRFSQTANESIELDLIFDGTGAIYGATTDSVDDQIEKFDELVFQYNGMLHANNFLLLSWGSLLFQCVLSTYTVTYTLFSPDGTPLRAEVKAKFEEYIEPDEEAAESDRSSPDITHQHQVVEGDTLPNLCHRFYKDPSKYLVVAHHNKLANFRKLKPGTVLHFPKITD